MSLSTSSPQRQARFLSGSLIRHVIVMALTGTIGLLAVFLVDVVNLLYLAQLEDVAITAALGFAGPVIFFTVSAGIGLSIATAALTSRAIGAGDESRAREIATAALFFMFVIMSVISAVLLIFLDPLLIWLGARDQVLALSSRFLWMVAPTVPFLGFGMAASAVLRALGDAKRAMYVTTTAGLVAAALDPVFIFGFDMALDGAALAMVFSRVAMVGISLHALIRVHNILDVPKWSRIAPYFKPLMVIAFPAVLTNVATPVGAAYVTSELAQFGNEAISAGAIINRLVPLSFCTLFALSAAVGPIVGQNFGAQNFERVRGTLYAAMGFVLVAGISACFALSFGHGQISAAFEATPETAELVRIFCQYGSWGFVFLGFLFVSNATFNTLGYAPVSTIFNWVRATIGTIPFVIIGADLYGAAGVVVAQSLGGIVISVIGLYGAFWVIRREEKKMQFLSL